MQFPQQSLTTSYSISFHPFRLLSINTCDEWAKADDTTVINSSRLAANPDPSPPRVKAALTSTGYPIPSAAAMAWGQGNGEKDWGRRGEEEEGEEEGGGGRGRRKGEDEGEEEGGTGRGHKNERKQKNNVIREKRLSWMEGDIHLGSHQGHSQ